MAQKSNCNCVLNDGLDTICQNSGNFGIWLIDQALGTKRSKDLKTNLFRDIWRGLKQFTGGFWISFQLIGAEPKDKKKVAKFGKYF